MKCLKYLMVFIALQLSFLVNAADIAAQRVYLSGKNTSDAVDWQFKCDKGRKCGEWTSIPVPSNWEQHGFGHYNYGHDLPKEKHDEIGTYKTTFFAPKAWKNKHVRLVFEGSMTETSVFLNGKKLGTTHLGGYVPFRHDLTKEHEAFKYGEENELTVVVAKKSTNESLEHAERKADYWVFGGIYRPVYLEIQNKSFINRVAIDAKADGTFKLDVFPQLNYITKFKKTPPIYVDEVYAQIYSLDGKKLGQPMSQPMIHGSGRVRLTTQVKDHQLWSPEYPTLYEVKVDLRKDGQVISRYTQGFGFRTFELRRQDGFYLNGKKIRIKGVNRNVFDPISGRAVSTQKVWDDARAIKSANINLVRSHLPPTTEFMEACDALGLLVITELTNWHDPWIDTPIGRNIAYELVTKYQNHPSVILWANGNESGFNLEIDDIYHLVDLQDRPVIHPWTNFEDIETFHYPTYKEFKEKLAKPTVYLPTEFLHGLYDGGHGAGLEDYWQAVMQSPTGAGGVLWCWGDAALSRTDKNGEMDTAGNMSSDGMVGPNGEKEASFYAVREIWSPIQIKQQSLTSDFSGKITVENGYYDTELNNCTFKWRLVNFSKPSNETINVNIMASGSVSGPAVRPGDSGQLNLNLPKQWQQADALALTAIDPHGMEVMEWSLPIEKAHTVLAKTSTKIEKVKGNPFELKMGQQVWKFSEKTGLLESSYYKGKPSGLANGPLLYGATENEQLDFSASWKASAYQQGADYIIKSTNEKDDSFTWTLTNQGTVTLDYDFSEVEQKLKYLSLGFDLPEDNVAAKTWLGNGPYRVWANRLKGVQYGIWQNDYNDKLTGLNLWGTPEFKGIFSGISWMKLELKSAGSLLIDPKENSYIGVLRPSNTIPSVSVHPKKLPRKGNEPLHAVWNYPHAGGLHFFHKLPGVGTKFMYAEESGPQGQPAQVNGALTGKITFQLNP
ncbi:glycoside hydrolase family 2 protein [Catenovulum adriaticum]|uniref:beta-galactosidase n=1 Tax=Catenovulum adriaticum TaxID=2984846 RepID=A0ABY7AS85_9ALTE|nr:glycoside hydrolase family 2 TIM barrel-domain containing protein [Catenovulum sp. TS8]WAJ72395.1 glycoside hydrolase family 2 [Catenovulum sp. TS8]